MIKVLLYWLILLVIICKVPLSAAQKGNKRIEVRLNSGETIPLYSGSYALVVGVSDYLKWPKLGEVKKDVIAVKKLLERRGFSVTVLENPNRNKLNEAILDFIIEKGDVAENRLLFYFAGHGYTEKTADNRKMGYIVPANAPIPVKDKKGFKRESISMGSFDDYARRINSKHALFIFDSCFAGSIFSVTRSLPPKIIEHKATKSVRQFITSGTEDQKVPDISSFRRLFIRALEGEGDYNNDRFVTGSELGFFLQDEVHNLSRGTQTPQYGKLKDPILGQGDFIFPLEEQLVQGKKIFTLEVKDEAEAWELVKDSMNTRNIQSFLKHFPNSNRIKLARSKLRMLETKQKKTSSSRSSLLHSPKLKKQVKTVRTVVRHFFDSTLKQNTITGYSRFIREYEHDQKARFYVNQAKKKLALLSQKKESENPCKVVCKGLVAYYPFNGDAKDKSGNGQNAKVVGATLTKDRKGNPKSAYRFDGIDDYIETGGLNKSLINKNSLSYMAIVKIAAVDQEKIRRITPDKPYVAPIITDSGRETEFQFTFKQKETHFYIWINNNVAQSKIIDPLKYNTIVGTYEKNSNRAVLYINGEKKREKILNTSLSTPSKYYFGIKDPSWKKSPKLNGIIDEIRIYNRALTESEVKKLYSNSL